MSGVAFAITAGVGFGIFQAVNRRANLGVDAYRATFGLLAIGTLGLSAVSIATQDLGALTTAPISSLAFYGAAGIVHFFFGWTFLTLSQQRVGASRTGAALAATPLVASVLAAFVLDEGLTPIIGSGVALVVAGLTVLSLRGMESSRTGRHRVPWSALGAAISWGTSPLFIRWGLEGLPAPLLGVTVGIGSATLAYAVALTITGRWGSLPRANLPWILLAGSVVAVAIAAQWTSYDLIAIAVAITLMQLSAPVVIVAAPLIVKTDMERVTAPLVIGTVLIMAGSILVILA